MPVLTPEYFLPSKWVPVLDPTYSLSLWFKYLFTLHQSVAQNHVRYVALHLRGQRGAASLCYINRAEITVLMCEKTSYPVWFSWLSACARAVRFSANITVRNLLPFAFLFAVPVVVAF